MSLYFTGEHEWIRVEAYRHDRHFRHAQQALGDIVFAQGARIGSHEQGR